MLFYHCPFTSLSRSFLFCKLFVHIYQTEPIIWFFIFFKLLNLVHFCEILHIHIFFVLLKSSYSFQARCFLFYKIFVHIPKVCMGTGFLLSLPNNVSYYFYFYFYYYYSSLSFFPWTMNLSMADLRNYWTEFHETWWSYRYMFLVGPKVFSFVVKGFKGGGGYYRILWES